MPPQTTSWRLIHAAAAGAAAERDEFARRYGPAAREYLVARWRHTLLLAEIDDAMQDIFVECFRVGGVLARVDATRHGGFRPFFYGVLRNVAQRVEQRMGRRAGSASASPSQLQSVPSAGESASVVFDRAWARAVMKDAAAHHLERARATGGAALRRYELLRLRFQEGMPIREIARLWQEDPAFLHHECAAARREFEIALREVVAERYQGSAADQERVLQELIDALG